MTEMVLNTAKFGFWLAKSNLSYYSLTYKKQFGVELYGGQCNKLACKLQCPMHIEQCVVNESALQLILLGYMYKTI